MFALRIGRDSENLPGKFWTLETAERVAADCSAHDSVGEQGAPVTYTVVELVRLAPMLPPYRRRVSAWQEGRRLINHPRRLRLPSSEQLQAAKVGLAMVLEVLVGIGAIALTVSILTVKI